MTLHKHLFTSYVLNGLAWILYYTLAALDAVVLADNPVSAVGLGPTSREVYAVYLLAKYKPIAFCLFIYELQRPNIRSSEVTFVCTCWV